MTDEKTKYTGPLWAHAEHTVQRYIFIYIYKMCVYEPYIHLLQSQFIHK